MEESRTPGRPIGSIFVEMGVITEEQLADALATQRETGELIGEILVARFNLSRLALASALAEQREERQPEPIGDIDLTAEQLEALLAPLRAGIDALEAGFEALSARLDALEQRELSRVGSPGIEVPPTC